MMTENLIERHFDAGRYEALLDILAANDAPMPLALRLRLAQSPACCVGLALDRLVDLTWGPNGLSRAMTAVLSQAVKESAGSNDPLVYAVVAAALGKVARQHDTHSAATVTPVLEQAMFELVHTQNAEIEQPLFGGQVDRTLQDKAMVSAFIVYLLGKDETFRKLTRFAELMTWFEQHRLELDEETQRLFVLARMRAGNQKPMRRKRKAMAA